MNDSQTVHQSFPDESSSLRILTKLRKRQQQFKQVVTRAVRSRRSQWDLESLKFQNPFAAPLSDIRSTRCELGQQTLKSHSPMLAASQQLLSTFPSHYQQKLTSLRYLSVQAINTMDTEQHYYHRASQANQLSEAQHLQRLQEVKVAGNLFIKKCLPLLPKQIFNSLAAKLKIQQESHLTGETMADEDEANLKEEEQYNPKKSLSSQIQRRSWRNEDESGMCNEDLQGSKDEQLCSIGIISNKSGVREKELMGTSPTSYCLVSPKEVEDFNQYFLQK